jgi:iron complex transport system ATP-binding protein
VSLRGQDLRYQIGGKALLRGIDLEVNEGEVVAVLGPNGAGKSTTLRAMSGDLRLSGGKVSLDGRPLEAWSVLERARRRAVLPQASDLNFPFSALEVALMGRAPFVRAAEGPRDVEIAKRALEMTGCEALAERQYPTLSGGERQRVQLARVLAQVWDTPASGERYLLLDEPTNSLDLAHQHTTLAIARRFASKGVGCLVILHDLNLAAQYADRIVILQAGRVLAAGKPREVLCPDLISRAFQVPVTVTNHPGLDIPLVVPLPSPDHAALSLVDLKETTHDGRIEDGVASAR